MKLRDCEQRSRHSFQNILLFPKKNPFPFISAYYYLFIFSSQNSRLEQRLRALEANGGAGEDHNLKV